MRKMKKFASLMLALVMVLALAAPAFASTNTDPVHGGEGNTNSVDDNNTTTTGTITIDNAVEGNAYAVYKLFDLVSYDRNTGRYSYKYNNKISSVNESGETVEIDNPWNTFMNSAKETYVTIDKDGYVAWVKDADVTAFAKAAIAYAKVAANGVTPSVAAKTPNVEKDSEGKTTKVDPVVFSDLPLGYYLVDSSMGALCSLSSTDNMVTVKDKNTKPQVDKEVQEDSFDSIPSADGWQNANDAQIGQTVNFKTKVTVGAGAENYVLHDKMSKGLTWSGTVAVTLNGTAVDTKNYTLKSGDDVSETGNDKCTFEIVFDNTYMAGLAQNAEIIVTYSAILNDEADIYTDANTNETWLKYGDDNHPENETPKSETKTYTYKFDLVKTDGKDGHQLGGAEFELYANQTKTEGETPIQLVKTGNTYRIATTAEINNTNVTKVTKIAVPETGYVTIVGLDANQSYWLEETKAPNGYNKLTERQEVVIMRELSEVKDGTVVTGFDTNGNPNNRVITSEDGTTTTTVGVGSLTGTNTDGNKFTTEEITDANGNKTTKYTWSHCKEVENNSGSLLPETGGIGTTIFYVVGGVLIAAAGVLLITKKRVNA